MEYRCVIYSDGFLQKNKRRDARTHTRTQAHTFWDMVFDYEMKLILGAILLCFWCISTKTILLSLFMLICINTNKCHFSSRSSRFTKDATRRSLACSGAIWRQRFCYYIITQATCKCNVFNIFIDVCVMP